MDAPVRYDLRPGRPDLASFPRAEWLRSLGAAVRGAGDAELDYPPIAGSLRLRTVLAAYRGRVRGTLATAHDIFVCLGAAQAFITICDALAPGRIAVEDPGHASIRGLLAQRGLEPVPTRVDEEGIVVAELPEDAKAVLVTPAHQFPTGVVMSAARRAELLAWAQERGALIVEDDYDAEYRYDRAPIGALQGLRPDLVAHVGSVSKTLAPALRLGWLIAPESRRAALLAAREGLDHGIPALRPARARRLHRTRRLRPPHPPQRPHLPAAQGRAARSARARAPAGHRERRRGRPARGGDTCPAPTRKRSSPPAAPAASSSTAPRSTAAARAATLLISFAAVPDAAAGHVAQLIASAL